LSRLSPDRREAQCPPPALVRRGPQEPAATDSVERSMNAPGRVHEPRRRVFRWSGCRTGHGSSFAGRTASAPRRRGTPTIGGHSSNRQRASDTTDIVLGPTGHHKIRTCGWAPNLGAILLTTASGCSSAQQLRRIVPRRWIENDRAQIDGSASTDHYEPGQHTKPKTPPPEICDQSVTTGVMATP
jgi:hypothetical protein